MEHFQFVVPKYYYHLGKMEFKESSLLIQGGYGLQGNPVCRKPMIVPLKDSSLAILPATYRSPPSPLGPESPEQESVETLES